MGAKTTSKVNFVNIPQELKANASFCVWKLEKRQGKPTKVPYNPKTGVLARTNEPDTFADFPTYRPQYSYLDQLRDFKKEMEEEPMAQLWGTKEDYHE